MTVSHCLSKYEFRYLMFPYPVSQQKLYFLISPINGHGLQLQFNILKTFFMFHGMKIRGVKLSNEVKISKEAGRCTLS